MDKMTFLGLLVVLEACLVLVFAATAVLLAGQWVGEKIINVTKKRHIWKKQKTT